MTEKQDKSPGRQKKSPPGQQCEEQPPVEIGGQSGPEPTRFGDWEKNGRCTDF